jgi:hypothetical protein
MAGLNRPGDAGSVRGKPVGVSLRSKLEAYAGSEAGDFNPRELEESQQDLGRHRHSRLVMAPSFRGDSEPLGQFLDTTLPKRFDSHLPEAFGQRAPGVGPGAFFSFSPHTALPGESGLNWVETRTTPSKRSGGIPIPKNYNALPARLDATKACL